MQSTLAFAPTQDDLDEFYFDVPVLTMSTPPEEPVDDAAREDELRAATA